MVTFGCHMIVKDAADVLLPILELSHLFDQFVIVDTGSTDDTIPLIQLYPNVDLHTFEWTNNFSAARNYALDCLHTETFMWLDADDLPTADDIEAWRKMAQFLVATKQDMYQLQYIYASDNFNNPLLVQYRERIFVDPCKWVWYGAIHETLEFYCQTTDFFGLTSDEHPVVHKPIRKPGDKDRNWTILRQSYLIDGKRDPNTLYYAQKEACGRGQDELAIAIGKELVAMNLDSYKHWEGLKHLGDSYTRLGKQDPQFYKLAEESYWAAIEATNGKFNEPIFALVECLLNQNKLHETLAPLELLNYFPPKNETVCLDKYGPAIFMFTAWAQTKFGPTQFNEVMHYYLQGIDTEAPIPLGLDVMQWLLDQIATYRIGVVYADEDADCMRVADKVRKMMLSTDMFQRVCISTSPLCASFATSVYFHITKTDATLYKEETDPKTLKILITDAVTAAYGYAETYPIPQTDEQFDEMLSIVYPYVDVIITDDLEDGLIQASVSRARYVIISPNDMTEELSEALIEQVLEGHQTPIVWERYDCKVCVVAGRTKDVQGFNIRDNELLLCVPHRLKHVELSFDAFDHFTTLPDHPRPKIVFYAEGIEQWDGLTPHLTGIGGSESSVIYLAEELAKDNRVIVLCTTLESRTINGVFYTNNSQLENLAEVDVFICSRCPEILTQRYGKKQFLWLHDVAESYDLDEIIVDKVITVSDREAFKVTNMTIKPVVTIPNGIHTECHHQTRVDGRCIWTSSPDRGLTDLLETQIKDMWITYSWAGINHCFRKSYDMYRKTIREKALLRKRGWKIVGRLPIDELRNLLATCQYWPYLSSFEESFCINVLEVVNQGVIPLICEEAGAAPETFMQYCGGYRNSFDYIIERHCMVDYIDGLVTKRETIAPYEDELYTRDDVEWDSVANKWKSLF